MRIGVDLHVLQGMYQGSKTYLESIYKEILKLNSDHNFVFYFDKKYPVPEFWNSDHEIVLTNGGSVRRLAFEFDRSIKKNKIDAFHSQYISPIGSGFKKFVTIHDVLFETHPQFFEKKFVIRSKILVRYSAVKADHIFTVSEYSKKSMMSLYGVDQNRITVTYNGVEGNSSFCDINAAKSEIKRDYGLDDFYLTVGRLEPRKNHITLLRAHRLLLDKGISLPKLVIIGQRDFRYSEVFEFIKKANLSDNVIILETINDTLLKKFYAAADFFVYPSFAEGFGIPPMEAIASGKPVITSGTTSMKELYAESALLVDPNDCETIAEAIYRIVNESCLREKIVKNGEILIKQFSWKNSAIKMLKVFNDCA